MKIIANSEVSIIIPFYNLGEYLEGAIESCLNQTYKNIEIIVVNDGSTDEKSIKILSDLKIKYKNKVNFIDQKNQGVSQTRNNGIKISKGKYICCLDADDTIEPTYIEKTTNFFKKDKNTGFVTTYAQFFGNEDIVWKTSKYDPIKLSIDNVVHVASIFKKSAWKKVNGYTTFKQGGYEDWDFWIKIVANGYRWELVPENLFYYRRRTNSMVSKSDLLRKDLFSNIIENNYNFYKKNLLKILIYNDQRFLKRRDEINDLDKQLKKLLKQISESNLTIKNQEIANKKLLSNISTLNNLFLKNKKQEEKIDSLNNQNSIMAAEINKYKSSKYYKTLIFKYHFFNNLKKIIKNPLPLINRTVKSKYKKTTDIPLVSVITPVYNRTKELIESIDSILNQTYKNFELIIVTDGSPKETLKVLEKYKSNPKIKIFKYFNQSRNAIRGRNKGIKEANGEYIAFQDSDDIAKPNRIEKSLEYINKYNADLVYGSWEALVDGSRKDISIKNGEIISSPESDLKSMKKLCIPCQSTVMVKRKALIEVGGLNPTVKYHEDHELWLRLLYFGYKFKTIPEPLIKLRLHVGNNEINFKKDDKKWHNIALENYKEKIKLPKKIAYLLPGTGIGGGVAVVCEHVNRLLKLGYDTLIITESETKDLSWFPNQSVNIVSMNDKEQLENIDILIMTGWSTAYSGKLIKAKRKIYFVQSDERRFFPEDKNFIKQVHESYTMDYEYITEAKWIQKWLKVEFNKNAYYVPNGVNADIFYPDTSLEAKPKNKLRILLEGPIDIPFKGMSDAFAAVQDLDCEVWCISSAGKPKPEWHCDRFFEKVPMQDMRKIYSSCDILVKMSRVEGFFGPPLEMMACGGVPIVAKVTGYDEYIKDGYNALVVEPGDINKVKEILKSIKNNKNATYKKIQLGAKKTVKKWSWQKSITKLKKLVDKP